MLQRVPDAAKLARSGPSAFLRASRSDRIIISRSSVGSITALEAGAAANLDSTPGVETFVIRLEKDQAKAITLICGFEGFTDTVGCTGLATA
jgi:hypothetical protein